jgi:two-component system, NarL family, nitrate/nitrite response regulator NarL
LAKFAATGKCTVRTLIVDDHPLFSAGLRLLLSGSTTIEDIVCCEAGAEALALAAAAPFDLVLLDWNLGSTPSGAPLVRELKGVLPLARVVIVSGESSASLIKLAIESGAVGFVPKESSPALLIDALTVTAHGGIYLPVAVLVTDGSAGLQALAKAAEGQAAPGGRLRSIGDAFPQLTPRQMDVLGRLIHGLPNKQIAREFDISDGTVKQHLNAIFRELDVQNRTEAVYLLAKSGVRFD